jgi:hypothetical protein
MGLPIQWLSHLRDPEERKQFEQAVRGSTLALDRLRDIIAIAKDSNTKQLLSFKSFDSPAWSERQAWICGSLSALEEIDKILRFSNDG